MEEKINPELEIKSVDIAVSAMNSAVGAFPIIGSFIIELVGITIPNQRFDRLIKFSTQLEAKLGKLDNSILKLALHNENFTDLMEESLKQAIRSLSDERRDYIASVIANSLTSDEADFIESKHILRVLGEINDIEVIWLRYSLCNSCNSDIEFRNKHEKILMFGRNYYCSSQSEMEKCTIHQSYREHLVELGLLIHEHDSVSVDSKGKVAIPSTSRRYRITQFGKLFLQRINLYEEV
jgi:hypothetical protein